MPVLYATGRIQIRAMTVYFHNFEGITDLSNEWRKLSSWDQWWTGTKSNVYGRLQYDSGTTVSGTQSLTNAVNYTVTNAVNGSKSYTYEESVSVGYKKALGVFEKLQGLLDLSHRRQLKNGWSNEKVKVKEQLEMIKVTITLPPYTAAYIRQQQKKQKAVTYYKCPVLINYDVTITGWCNNICARNIQWK